MRMRYALVLLLFLCSTLTGPAGSAQGQQSSSAARKIVRQNPPMYPELAKRMNVVGTVKVLAVVAADGEVKSVEPLGGSPLLIKAAQDAVAKWKFAPGSESREIIELHFTQ